MRIEFWKVRGTVSFARDETICVKNGSGRVVEKITCLRVGEMKEDAKGDYRLCKMEVVHV